MDAVSSARTLSVASSDGEREQIRHACHRHPLKLISLKLDQQMCDICETTSPQEQSWGCTESGCDFRIHNSCLNCLPEIVQLKSGSRLEDWILYSPDHYHICIDCNETLQPKEVAFTIGAQDYDDDKSLCIRCCLGRKLTDDDSSLRVPLSINHFFHPCKLYLTFSPSSTCNACFLNHHHLSYSCRDCDFFLDFECAQISKDSHLDDLNQIHHFCHWHPLQLFPEEEAIDRETLCKICESSSSSSSTISDPFYGCNRCQFYAHKSCMHFLPRETIHPSLDEILVLLTVPSYVCFTCHRACSGLTFFYSIGKILEQQIYFCVKCILWPRSEFGDDGGFESIHHPHELTFREVDDEYVCFMCARDCSGWIYVCSKCSIYCHKSCAEMPRELLHPIHPHYPLTCTAVDTSGRFKCNLCSFPFDVSCHVSRVYRCGSCRFSLDSYCASQSFIQYEGHPHPIYVTNNLPLYVVDCYKCSKTISRYSTSLHCTKCNFILHLECGPLPSKIKDPRHAHALTFQEYYVEDNMSDKFACHICEEKRNPRRPVYMCTQGCLMTCEVECVLEEVLASLVGKRGVLELETVYPKVACKLITIDSNWKEITCASSGENVARDVPIFSLEELIELAKPDFESEPLEEGSNNSNSAISDLRGDNSSQSEYDGSSYPYTRKDLKEFIRKIEGNQGIGFEWNGFGYIFSQLEGSSIGGDYMLPNTLDSVYRNFFAKHTLFGPDCQLNYDSRRLIVFYICSILHDMRMTKLVDVSAEKITLWSSALKAVRKMYRCNGLELDYLFKHVTRIAEDHYMVRAVDIIETTFSNLCNKKEELSARKERLIRELAETESQIEDNNKELRSFRAYRAAGASETKKEYYASLENKWRPCYEC